MASYDKHQHTDRAKAAEVHYESFFAPSMTTKIICTVRLLETI